MDPAEDVPGPGFAAAFDQVDLHQVLDRPGDRRCSDAQLAGELGGRELPGVGDQQRRVHARGRPGHPGFDHDLREPFPEIRDGVFVGSRHRSPPQYSRTSQIS
nr:hypothetical protein [Nocardiopsis salina]